MFGFTINLLRESEQHFYTILHYKLAWLAAATISKLSSTLICTMDSRCCLKALLKFWWGLTGGELSWRNNIFLPIHFIICRCCSCSSDSTKFIAASTLLLRKIKQGLLRPLGRLLRFADPRVGRICSLLQWRWAGNQNWSSHGNSMLRWYWANCDCCQWLRKSRRRSCSSQSPWLDRVRSQVCLSFWI